MCFIVDKYMWTTHCGAGIFCCVCSHGNMLLYSVAILGPCLILDIQWYDVVSCLFVCFLWKHHVSLLDSCLDLSLIQRILGSQMQVYIWHVLSTPDNSFYHIVRKPGMTFHERYPIFVLLLKPVTRIMRQTRTKKYQENVPVNKSEMIKELPSKFRSNSPPFLYSLLS